LYHLTPANGYPEITNAGTVQYLFIDENEILWASLGGITLIDLKGNEFEIRRILSYPDSLYDERAECFWEDEESNIWVGTEKNGVYQFDRELNFIANYKACNWDPKENSKGFNNMVWRIYEDPHRRIWMSTGPTCLSIFDRYAKEFHAIDVSVGSYSPGRLIIDPFDIVWLTAHDGLHKGTMDGDKNLQVTLYENPTLPKTPIDGILYDAHDRLWLITRSSGVFCLHPEDRDSMIFTRYLHKNYHDSFTVEYNAREMTEDPEGNIWFISHRELFRYDTLQDSIVPVEDFNRKFREEIFSVTRDHNGVIWLGIEIGMLAYRYSETGAGILQKIDYRSGMPFTFLTRGPFFHDSRGYIYQGGQMTTERGFFRFHPDSLPGLNITPPPVVLTNFSVHNKPFALDSNITYKKAIVLTHKQNFFAFEFAALDYLGPEKNQYAYMLEGIDNDWVYPRGRRYANYTGIPAGTYTFRVKGSNNDGFWNEKGTTIRLTILPPPWKSWWAYTLYTLAFITLIILWRLYDLKRQRLKQALKIEKVEAEKLKELDSMKSRFFANISHEFRTPLTLILGPLEKLISTTEDEGCVKDLSMMQRNAKRLQRLINQLLNLSKLEAGEMKLIAGERNIVSLVRGYVHSFESLAKQKNIRLKFSSDDERTLVYVDNDKIEKILYNLLSNAFKFTPSGGEIAVSVITHPVSPFYREGTKGGVNIVVADTGPGIPPDKVKLVFKRFYQADNGYSGDQEGTGIGLALTQELVKLHGGDIIVESKEGQGTTFIVTLQKGYEHLKPDQIKPRIQDQDEDSFSEIKFDELPSESHGKTAEVDNNKGDKPIVLIIEDNDDLRSYIRSYLEEKYVVHEAVNGLLGLESTIEKVPDLVISDV
ncbi:MAG TPA: ATP-binding protein, partial [Bacteroidales bacterium]|nr:ATP-binding protein [Bacteroidales bacterium]